MKGVCQPVIQCEQSRREIRFIDLNEISNEPFHSVNRGLSTIVLNEIRNGNIQPLYIDYSNGSKQQSLDKAAFLERLRIKSDSEFPAQLIFPSQLSIVGFDQTAGIFNEKEFSQVHYVNFYTNDDILTNSKDGRYCFSVRWSDFIKLFIEKKNYLYSTNSYGSWWRGDVFVTQQYYAVDKGTCGEFIQLAQSDSTFKAYDYKNPAMTYDLSAFKEVSYKGYPLDLRFIEHQQDNGVFAIDTILVQTISDNDPYKSSDQIAFAWNSFLKVSSEKNWYANSSIYRMSDAILLQKFHYSISIPYKIISTNGLFVNGTIDSLYNKELINSFYIPITPTAFDFLQVKMLEGVYLSDPHNAILHKPEHDLVEIIYENVLNGKLKAFNNDSLVTELGPRQVRLNANKIIDIPEYEFDRKYRKGAVFSLNYQDSITHNYEIQYYQVKKQFKSKLDLPAKKFTAKIVLYETPIYKAAQLDVIELIQRITFNVEGKNKQYHLQGIGIKVPADIDARGIEYPVAYVCWEDLKKILLNDPRAIIVYQGKQTNFVDLIENRLFQAVFYKSDYIEPAE